MVFMLTILIGKHWCFIWALSCSFWKTNEDFLMRLLPSIYFLWGRIFRSLSLLKSTVILIFFNLKNFHIIWAHQKCESSDLYCFNFSLAIWGLLSIHVNLMITSSMCVKRCWSLIEIALNTYSFRQYWHLSHLCSNPWTQDVILFI